MAEAGTIENVLSSFPRGCRPRFFPRLGLAIRPGGGVYIRCRRAVFCRMEYIAWNCETTN